MEKEVHVVPNAKRFAVEEKDGKLKVWLPEKAEAGKANLGLVKRLSGFLGCDVRLMRGLKSRKKTIAVDCDEKMFLAKVSSGKEG